MSPDGPEEREFDANESYERDIDDADVAAISKRSSSKR
jgi:hypothetical protein